MDPDERVPRIGEVKIKIRPEYYLQKARQEQTNGNDVLAIENYVNYMENLGNQNEMKLEEQINLTKLVLNLGSALEAKEAEDEVMKCYVGILNHFPKNVLILNAFAVYLFSKGEYNVAKGYFQRAAAEGYLPAEKNLLHVMWNLIPRWHFRMLNDAARNRAYQQAIQKAIKSGFKNVFDIGAGCGLLTLIAATTNEEEVHVTAFEENKTLYNIAQKVVKSYNLKNVTLSSQNSNEVVKPATTCNLIVTEIFDAALFGENCLKSLSHALAHFVKDKNFRIIPASAVLYVTGIESVNLTKNTRYVGTLSELGLEDVCIRESEPELYDCEYLKNEKVEYITETKSFLTVNFQDKVQLRNLLTKSDCIEEFEVKCSKDGVIHAFAVWFDLKLDEEITISTSPMNPEIKCWEQAVFHLKHPLPVKKGENLKIKPMITNSQLSFNILSRGDQCQKCLEVSREVISFLNDKELVESIKRSVDCYKKYDIKIVDFNIFPLFGLLMAKKGALVYHVYKEAEDLKLFQYLLEVNKLCTYKVIFVHEKAVEEFLVYLEPPDLVYTDLIKTDGSWNKMELTVETESKLNCENLPKKIFLKAQLVTSSYIDVCNKVDDSKALDFKLSEHMNEFSGTEHPHLNFFPHEKCSTVVVFDITDPEVIDFHADVSIIKAGTANGIFYWFDMQITDDETIIFSTLNSTHYGKICTIFKTPKVVTEGENVTVHVLRGDGHLKVYCD